MTSANKLTLPFFIGLSLALGAPEFDHHQDHELITKESAIWSPLWFQKSKDEFKGDSFQIDKNGRQYNGAKIVILPQKDELFPKSRFGQDVSESKNSKPRRYVVLILMDPARYLYLRQRAYVIGRNHPNSEDHVEWDPIVSKTHNPLDGNFIEYFLPNLFSKKSQYVLGRAGRKYIKHKHPKSKHVSSFKDILLKAGQEHKRFKRISVDFPKPEEQGKSVDGNAPQKREISSLHQTVKVTETDELKGEARDRRLVYNSKVCQVEGRQSKACRDARVQAGLPEYDDNESKSAATQSQGSGTTKPCRPRTSRASFTSQSNNGDLSELTEEERLKRLIYQSKTKVRTQAGGSAGTAGSGTGSKSDSTFTDYSIPDPGQNSDNTASKSRPPPLPSNDDTLVSGQGNEELEDCPPDYFEGTGLSGAMFRSSRPKRSLGLITGAIAKVKSKIQSAAKGKGQATTEASTDDSESTPESGSSKKREVQVPVAPSRSRRSLGLLTGAIAKVKSKIQSAAKGKGQATTEAAGDDSESTTEGGSKKREVEESERDKRFLSLALGAISKIKSLKPGAKKEGADEPESATEDDTASSTPGSDSEREKRFLNLFVGAINKMKNLKPGAKKEENPESATEDDTASSTPGSERERRDPLLGNLLGLLGLAGKTYEVTEADDNEESTTESTGTPTKTPKAGTRTKDTTAAPTTKAPKRKRSIEDQDNNSDSEHKIEKRSFGFFTKMKEFFGFKPKKPTDDDTSVTTESESESTTEASSSAHHSKPSPKSKKADKDKKASASDKNATDITDGEEKTKVKTRAIPSDTEVTNSNGVNREKRLLYVKKGRKESEEPSSEEDEPKLKKKSKKVKTVVQRPGLLGQVLGGLFHTAQPQSQDEESEEEEEEDEVTTHSPKDHGPKRRKRSIASVSNPNFKLGSALKQFELKGSFSNELVKKKESSGHEGPPSKGIHTAMASIPIVLSKVWSCPRTTPKSRKIRIPISPKDFIHYHLTFLKAQCLRDVNRHLVKLFSVGLLTVENGLVLTVNPKHPLIQTRALNRQGWLNLVSGLFFAAHTNALLDPQLRTGLTSQTLPNLKKPQCSDTIGVSQSMALFGRTILNVIRTMRSIPNLSKFHSYKLSQYLESAISERLALIIDVQENMIKGCAGMERGSKDHEGCEKSVLVLDMDRRNLDDFLLFIHNQLDAIIQAPELTFHSLFEFFDSLCDFNP